METIQYCSLLQITGDGKEWTIVNEKTSIDLSSAFQAVPPISLPLKQLSCQLTDPWNRQVPCSITPTQPGVCTVMYTPTICGPHQLSIKIKDTDIQGSPFRVSVLPEAVRGVKRHIIAEDERPQSVAVSKSGDIVVCHDCRGNNIGVFNRKGEKKLSFRSGGKYSRVAITCTADNHILAANENKSQIVKYTMEGRPVKCVECSKLPTDFNQPSSITVHPSGKVVVASMRCSSIQVLNPDLTHSHLFSHGVVGNSGSLHVACDSNGVVYVACNSCIRSFNIDGQCISNCSYNFTVGTTISGICIDSTNTLYVSDRSNKSVLVLSNNGKFIKCLSLDGNEQELITGIAIDSITGALYVCDYNNKCVIVY